MWLSATRPPVNPDLRHGEKMPVKVIIPTPLRPYAGKRESAEFTAATVGEALASLTLEFADLRKHLFTEDGKLRSFVNVYVNDEDIRYLSKENTPVKDGDTISIVPSIAGGRQCRRTG
jgi:molybdopterin converting factor small subunit